MREYFIDLNDENILLDLAEPLRDVDEKESETGADKAAASGQSLVKHKEKGGKAGEGKIKAGKLRGAKEDGDEEVSPWNGLSMTTGHSLTVAVDSRRRNRRRRRRSSTRTTRARRGTCPTTTTTTRRS